MQDKDLNKFSEKSIHSSEAQASVDEAWEKMSELLSKENSIPKNKKPIFKKLIFSMLLLLLLIPTCHYFNNIFEKNISVAKKDVDNVLANKNSTPNILDTIFNTIRMEKDKVASNENEKVSTNKKDAIKNSLKIIKKQLAPTQNNNLKSENFVNVKDTVVNRKIKAEIDIAKNSNNKMLKLNSMKHIDNKDLLDLELVENNKLTIPKLLKEKQGLNLKKQKSKKSISRSLEKNSLGNIPKKYNLLKNIRSNAMAKDDSINDNDFVIKNKLLVNSNKEDNDKTEAVDTSAFDNFSTTKKQEKLKLLDKYEETKSFNSDSSSIVTLKTKIIIDSLENDKLENKTLKKSLKNNFFKSIYGLNWQIPMPIKNGTFTNVYGNNLPFTNLIPELFVEKPIGKRSYLIFSINPYHEQTNNTVIINKEAYVYTLRRSTVGPTSVSYLVDSLTYIKTLSINKTIGIAGFMQYKKEITSKFSIAYGIGFVQHIYGIVNNRVERESGEKIFDSTYSISNNNQLWEKVNKNIIINRLEFNYKIKPRWQLGLSILKPFTNILKNEAEDKKPFNLKINLRWVIKK